MNNLFKSYIFAEFCCQTSKMRFLRKCFKSLAIFSKAPVRIYEDTPIEILNTPVEGFVQDAPREELSIAPVVEFLTTTAW